MPSEKEKKFWKSSTFRIEVVVIVAGLIISLIGFTVSKIWNLTHELQDLKRHMLSDEALSDTTKAEISQIKERLTSLEVRGVAGAAYAQLSSAKTQRHTKPGPVALEMELRDAVRGIDFDPRRDKTVVRVLLDGAYFIMAAPQVGREPGTSGASATLDFFLSINGKPIDNSNVTITLPKGDDSVKDVIISQGIVPLRKGDEVSVMMSSFGPKGSLGVEAIQPKNEPLVPSIIFSMFRLGET